MPPRTRWRPAARAYTPRGVLPALDAQCTSLPRSPGAALRSSACACAVCVTLRSALQRLPTRAIPPPSACWPLTPACSKVARAIPIPDTRSPQAATTLPHWAASSCHASPTAAGHQHHSRLPHAPAGRQHSSCHTDRASRGRIRVAALAAPRISTKRPTCIARTSSLPPDALSAYPALSPARPLVMLPSSAAEPIPAWEPSV